MGDLALVVVLSFTAVAVLAAVVGLFMPAVVARLPEPEPKPQPELESEQQPENQSGEEPEPEPEHVAAAHDDEGPKELYVDIARLPRLGLALASASFVVAWIHEVLLIARADDPGLLAAVGALMWAVLTPLLLMLSVIDWRTRLLPTRLIIPATIAVILVGLVAALVERDLQVWIRALLGMLALRTFLWILWALRQGGMGFGDVRLGALVGFVLGWFGWAEVIIGIYAALGCFSLFVVGAAALKRDRSRLKLFTPFGPFLVAGGFVGAWFGPAIAAYLGYGSG